MEFFGLRKPDGLSQAKKSQKGLRRTEKQIVFKLQLKILQKKLTHHEKMPAFFLSLVPYHIDAHIDTILGWAMFSNDDVKNSMTSL